MASQTAQDYIATQLSLEADAREALPYQFDTCTYPLGALRQSIYACLTCSPPPASVHQHYNPAGVCYSCSISCHGEHTLVELFAKRDFVCDCGTTRLSNSGTPCKLRMNAAGMKGDVRGEEPRQDNNYNHNFKGRFCGCGEEYEPEKEKGTMFQCLGLGTVQEGGCGEDWWHPECLVGLPRSKVETKEEDTGELQMVQTKTEYPPARNHVDADVAQGPNVIFSSEDTLDHDQHIAPGFPREDDFDHFICYKCADAFPWIKSYAGMPGFLPGIPSTMEAREHGMANKNKRKADDEVSEVKDTPKRARANSSDPSNETKAALAATIASDDHDTNQNSVARHAALPTPSSESISLFMKEDFRDHFCRCPECFPQLAKHSQLLEEEETYEPPLSESDEPQGTGSVAGRSITSGSLLDRGEAALSSIDRVRAIEGVMAYNHVRDKVKGFLQPFAQSGQPVSAEDIKAYFAKLRGDEQAMREAKSGDTDGGVRGDGRKEQDGY